MTGDDVKDIHNTPIAKGRILPINRSDKDVDQFPSMQLTEYDLPWNLSHSIEHTKLIERMTIAINAMNGRKYEVWKLLLAGKTQDDVAAILGISRSSVQTFYRRGIKELRGLLS